MNGACIPEPMPPRSLLGLIAGMIAVGALLVSGGAAAVPLVSGSHAGVNASVSDYASTNWAGYFASSTALSVTKVGGTWVEPAARCTSAPRYAVFWVGIDGAGSPTVEQTGTFAICYGGTASYYAWWELYPLNSIQIIGTISVHPGDTIAAFVTFAAGEFTMSITDGAQKFSTVGTQPGTERNSAECIVERPSLISGGEATLAHLANFGVVTFSSCTATIGGVSGGIGTFANVGEITMVSQLAGHATLALPSALGATKSSFSVTWKKAN